MYIESPANEKVRLWSKLKTNKGRKEQQLMLVEGLKLVEELLNSAYETLYLLWDAGTVELPERLVETAERHNVRFYELSPAAFAAVADTVTPQGVIGVAALPHQSPTYPRRVLMLDGLQDPGNVGTLLRAADGFNIKEVVCGAGTVNPFAPKVVRASMGGLFRLSLQIMDPMTYIQQWLAAWPDGQVSGTSAEAELECHKADFQSPSIIVVGNEASGMSRAVANACNRLVRIPMSKETESLNAAMAGSILMYEAYRQGLNQ